MPESESMSTGTISTTREVDPAFREVVAMLYGDAVDIRQVYDLAKAENASTRSAREKNERTQARVGLASNIVGLGAGVAGTAAALRDERFKEGGKLSRKLYEAGQKIPKPISGKTGKAGALLAGGALGLQVANMAGDVVANRVLARATKTPGQRAKQVHKALDDGMREIVAARRSRVIDSDTAIEMAVNLAKSLEAELEDVSKWDPAGIGRTLKTAATVQGRPFAVAPPQRLRLAGRKARRLNPVARANDRARSMTAAAANAGRARTFALRGTAGLAGGGGLVVGHRQGRKKGNREVLEGGVTKAMDTELVDYGFTGEISKVDADRQLVFGWCSLSEIDGEPVVDLQNDYAPIDEIEKSAYAYVLESRKGGDMHARDGDQPVHTADLVESMIVTPEKLEQMGLSSEVAKSMPTGWWVGFKVNDEQQWTRVKNGERAGFSIHGKGNRVSKVLA